MTSVKHYIVFISCSLFAHKVWHNRYKSTRKTSSSLFTSLFLYGV